MNKLLTYTRIICIYFSILTWTFQPIYAQDTTYYQEEYEENPLDTLGYDETQGEDVNTQLQEKNQEYYEQTAVEGISLNEKKWKEITKDLHYLDPPLPEKKEKKSWDLSMLSSILRLLVMLFLAGVVLFLLYKFRHYFALPKLGRKDADYRLEEVEADLPNADLEAYLQEAIRAGNYTLAVRLYYLLVIKELSIKNIIQWKRNKTNRDYAAELHGNPFKTPFKELTLNFEYVWYGQTPIDQARFEVLRTKFDSLIREIRQNQG